MANQSTGPATLTVYDTQTGRPLEVDERDLIRKSDGSLGVWRHMIKASPFVPAAPPQSNDAAPSVMNRLAILDGQLARLVERLAKLDERFTGFERQLQQHVEAVERFDSTRVKSVNRDKAGRIVSITDEPAYRESARRNHREGSGRIATRFELDPDAVLDLRTSGRMPERSSAVDPRRRWRWRTYSERLRAASPRCSLCGAWAGDRYVERGVSRLVRLSVDHIDGNPQNNQRANLRVLCVSCHSSLTADGWRR
jgi:hypothetical protein